MADVSVRELVEEMKRLDFSSSPDEKSAANWLVYASESYQRELRLVQAACGTMLKQIDDQYRTLFADLRSDQTTLAKGLSDQIKSMHDSASTQQEQVRHLYAEVSSKVDQVGAAIDRQQREIQRLAARKLPRRLVILWLLSTIFAAVCGSLVVAEWPNLLVILTKVRGVVSGS